MVHAQSRIYPGEWDTQTPLRFDKQTDHLISARRPDLIIINTKKENLPNSVPADYRVKLKEIEKRDKYLDLARGLKKL